MSNVPRICGPDNSAEYYLNIFISQLVDEHGDRVQRVVSVCSSHFGCGECNRMALLLHYGLPVKVRESSRRDLTSTRSVKMAAQQQQQQGLGTVPPTGMQQATSIQQQLSQQQDVDPVQRFKMLIPQLKESLQVTRGGQPRSHTDGARSAQTALALDLHLNRCVD